MTTYRKYSKEFKLQAARLVTEQGYSYKQAAKRLGATGWSIRNWVKKFRQVGRFLSQYLDVVDVPAGIRICTIQDRIGPPYPHCILIGRHCTEIILHVLPCRVRDIAVARRFPSKRPSEATMRGFVIVMFIKRFFKKSFLLHYIFPLYAL